MAAVTETECCNFNYYCLLILNFNTPTLNISLWQVSALSGMEKQIDHFTSPKDSINYLFGKLIDIILKIDSNISFE